MMFRIIDDLNKITNSFFSSKSRKRKRGSHNASLEFGNLEPRRMLATASAYDGLLDVLGTDGGEVIRVRKMTPV